MIMAFALYLYSHSTTNSYDNKDNKDSLTIVYSIKSQVYKSYSSRKNKI